MTSFSYPKQTSRSMAEDIPTLNSAPEPTATTSKQKDGLISFSQERRLITGGVDGLFSDTFYGKTYRPTVHSPWQQMLIEDAQMLLDNPRQQASFIPSPPPGLIEILLHESPAKTLSTLLSRDKVLSKNVLKLANSRFFRKSTEPVTSLRNALAIQGVEGLLVITASAMMHPILNCKSHLYGDFGSKLWGLSLINATLCRTLTNDNHTHPTIAFLAGMLYHMGAIPIFSYVEQRLERRDASPSEDNLWLFNDLIQRYSREMGGVIAHNWGLPDDLIIGLSEQSFEQEDISSPLGQQLYNSFRATQVAWCLRSKTIEHTSARKALQLWNISPSTINKIMSTPKGS